MLSKEETIRFKLLHSNKKSLDKKEWAEMITLSYKLGQGLKWKERLDIKGRSSK